MDKIGRKNKIDIVLEIVWLTTIFLIPLFFLREMHNSFEIPKNILFQSLTEILLFIYLIKIILYGLPEREFLWQRIKYFMPAFIFIIILGISTIFSQVPWFSFWGSWERRMGYLAWLHFFLFALILILNIKNNKQIVRLLFTIVACSFFVAVYGMIQALGLEPFEWTDDPFLLKRIFSTVGQPNFLGSWLLLVMPVSLLLFLRGGLISLSGRVKKNFIFTFLSFVLLILLFWALIATGSRGAWVGLIASICFLSTIFFWQKNQKLIIIPLFCLIVLIGLVGFLNWAGSNKISLSGNPFLSRLQTFTDLKAAGNYRLMHWRAAWDLIKKRPFLGYGLGAQRFNFPRYYVPEFSVYEKPNIYLDYAHNDILDILFTAGFLGLASYLFLIGSVFWLGFKYIFNCFQSPRLIKQGNSISQLMILCLLTGLFGYLISILFSFHVMSTLVYFWLFIVLVIILSQDLIQDDNELTERGVELTPKKSLLILLFLIILIIGWWQFNARLYLSSRYFFQAQKAKSVGNWQEAIKEHQRAISFSPHDPYFHQEFALTLYQLSNFISTPTELVSEWTPDLKQKIVWLDLGIENLKEIPENERPIEALMWLPWLETEKAYLTKQEEDFVTAEKSFQNVASFSPQTALIYNKWCELKIYWQKWAEAIEICERAKSLYPDINHPHISAEHQQNVIKEMLSVYLNLGKIYQQMNDFKKAIDHYQKSVYFIKRFYPSSNDQEILKYIYTKMSLIYSQIGEQGLAEFYFKKTQ